MDISGSMEGHLGLVSAFMKEIIFGLNFKFIRTRVAYMTYASTPTIHFMLKDFSDQRDVLNAVKITDIGFETNPAGALAAARQTVFIQQNGDRPGVKNSIIMFSDGKNNYEGPGGSMENEADALKASGIDIFAIAIGPFADRAIMRKMTSTPENVYLKDVVWQSDVHRNAEELLNSLCDG